MSSYNIQKWQHECIKNRESIGKKVKRVHCLCYSHQRPSWITFTPKTDGFFSHFSPPKSHCSNSAMAPHAVYLPGKNTNTTSPLPKQRVHIQLLCHIQLQSKGATTPRDQLPEAFHPVGHSSAPQRSVLSAPSAPCLPNARKQDRKQGGLLPKYYPWLTKHLMFIFSFFFFSRRRKWTGLWTKPLRPLAAWRRPRTAWPRDWRQTWPKLNSSPKGNVQHSAARVQETLRGFTQKERRINKRQFLYPVRHKDASELYGAPRNRKNEYKQAKLFLSISLWRSENVVFYAFK